MRTKKVELPKFDKKEFVKLSELAKELELDYRSLFMKQARIGIFACKTLVGDRKVVCFTKENADKIRKATAPFILKNLVELQEIEKKLKVVRPEMLKILAKLKIEPEKRRRNEKVPRSVLTVKKNTVNKIKEAVRTLV